MINLLKKVGGWDWDIPVMIGGLLLMGFCVGFLCREFNPPQTEKELLDKIVSKTILVDKLSREIDNCKEAEISRWKKTNENISKY
jgi:hypothetical protein